MQRAHGLSGEQATGPPQNDVRRATGYSYPPTPLDWARIQETIYRYYVVDNLALNKVRERLRTLHGFKATDRMIKARLAKWEYIKNAKKDDWGYLAVLHERRKQQNKPTVFEIRGHRKTVKDLQRFIRNQNSSPEQFVAQYLDDIRAGKKEVPDYIRAFTPDPETLLSLPSADTPQSDGRLTQFSHTPSPGRPPPRQLGDVYDPSDTYSPYEDVGNSDRDIFRHRTNHESDATALSTFSDGDQLRPNMLDPQVAAEGSRLPCDRIRIELEACSDQLLRPEPLISRIGGKEMSSWNMISARDSASGDDTDFTDNQFCSRCHQPSDWHFASLDNFEPRQETRSILNDSSNNTWHLPVSTREEGSWLWISRCFLACIHLTRHNENLAKAALDSAANEFERRLQAGDPLILTAAVLMIAILHTHDQQTISERILENAKNVTDRVFPEGDPIRFTVSYLSFTANTTSSGEQLAEAGFTCSALEAVYSNFRSRYTADHPYTIAAHYNYAWLLKRWGLFAEAEKHAREVYAESSRVFKRIHMQSIMSLAVLAGCLVYSPERRAECLDTYRKLIEDASDSLGISHPYVLEAQRRLGNLLYEDPRISERLTALKIQRAVLFGKARMLGRKHRFTVGQRELYEGMLQELGKWEDGYRNASVERQEVRDLFSRQPEESWLNNSREAQDMDMTDASGTDPNRGRGSREEEWSRQVLARAVSRSSSPTSSTEFEAY